MCELRERTQYAFDDSCVAFANRHNLEDVAKQVAMKPNMLRNKMNPNMQHQLTVRDMLAITEATGDDGLVRGIFCALDMVAAKVPANGGGKSLVEHALVNAAHAGDLSRHAIELVGHSTLPRTKRQKLKESCHSALANMVLLVNELENRTASTNPFIGMATDMVANGFPMPGIA
ncbi:phage regulatory CII family protein [Parasalinivibrio latis]|uniref:phage regulatory CII family protein n=1 Tax=Parasalinivibrio latis TaxID=2952610 RepID=UPI0030DFB832